jgi:hypothetical protein
MPVVLERPVQPDLLSLVPAWGVKPWLFWLNGFEALGILELLREALEA